MIQETRLEGDYIKILPRNFMMLHHGPALQPRQGAKGGVAIILSPGMSKNWKHGGRIIHRGGISAEETTRIMSIDVEIKMLVKTKSKSKFKHVKVLLLTSYHPTSAYKESDAVNFNDQVPECSMKSKKTNILIMSRPKCFHWNKNK